MFNRLSKKKKQKLQDKTTKLLFIVKPLSIHNGNKIVYWLHMYTQFITLQFYAALFSNSTSICIIQ